MSDRTLRMGRLLAEIEWLKAQHRGQVAEALEQASENIRAAMAQRWRDGYSEMLAEVEAERDA